MGGEKRDFLDEMFTTEAVSQDESDTPTGAEDEVEQAEEVEAHTGERETEDEADSGDAGGESEETQAATPADDPKARGTLAGLMAEREKRQNAETQLQQAQRELAEARAVLARAQQGGNAAPAVTAAPPDFYANPKAYVDNLVGAVQAEANERLFQTLERSARERHKDFDEVAAIAMAEAQRVPAMTARIMQASDPAEELYQQGLRVRQLSQPVETEEQMRERIRAEVMAEAAAAAGVAGAQAKVDAARAGRDAVKSTIPPDLAKGRSASVRTTAPPPDPLEQLFPRGG